MLPVQAFIDNVLNRIATDASGTYSLASADGINIGLAAAAFTPSPALAVGDITVPSFASYAQIACVTGNQLVVNNPNESGAKGIALKVTGPIRWILQSGDLPGGPWTIYGFTVNYGDGNDLIATQLLPAPVTLTRAGDFVEIPAEFGFFGYLPIGPAQ